MRAHSSDRQTGKAPTHSDTRAEQAGAFRPPPQDAGKAPHPGTFSPAHLLQLQQTMGNRAVARSLNALVRRSDPVIQRVLDETGEALPIDWDTLSPLMAMNVMNQITNGGWIAEEGDLARLNAIIEGGPSTETKMEIEEGSDEEDEDFVPGLNPDQEELFASIEPGFVEKMNARKGRKLPGKMVQGGMLEHYVSTFSGDMGIEEMDANRFSMNIPGIDHMVDSSTHPFIQDKMHLSEHTARTETYRAHYANRHRMAENLLKSMATAGKKGADIRSMFESALTVDTWLHKSVIQRISDAVKAHMRAYEEALDSEVAVELPNILDDEELVALVGNCIAFAVPADIWEALYQGYENGEIPGEEMGAYQRLDLDTGEFMQVFAMLNHVAAPYNERKPKEGDEDYEGDG